MSSQLVSFITLDVFTSTPYAGNPLAVVLLPTDQPHKLTKAQKQLIAREFNLSETIFVHLPGKHGKDGVEEWEVEIFMTEAELPFAGHPVIGSAFWLLTQSIGGPSESKLEQTDIERKGRLITKAGPIGIQLAHSLADRKVQATIPHNVHIHNAVLSQIDGSPNLTALSSDLDIRARELNAPVMSIVPGMSFLLVKLESTEMLGKLQPTSGWGKDGLDLTQLFDKGEWDTGFVGRYYYVLSASDTDSGVVTIRTRMLEAKMEDPATGSAACALCSYLALQSEKSGKFNITQGFEMGRKSDISVEVDVSSDGKKVEAVRLIGTAVEVMSGKLTVKMD